MLCSVRRIIYASKVCVGIGYDSIEADLIVDSGGGDRVRGLPATAQAVECGGCGGGVRLTAHAMPQAVQVSVLGTLTEGFVVALDPNKPMCNYYYCYCSIGLYERRCATTLDQREPDWLHPAGDYRDGEGSTPDHYCQWINLTGVGWVCWNTYGCP